VTKKGVNAYALAPCASIYVHVRRVCEIHAQTFLHTCIRLHIQRGATANRNAVIMDAVPATVVQQREELKGKGERDGRDGKAGGRIGKEEAESADRGGYKVPLSLSCNVAFKRETAQFACKYFCRFLRASAYTLYTTRV